MATAECSKFAGILSATLSQHHLSGFESAVFNMPANLENAAVDTGLEKVSFHSNSKERQCKIVLKLLHIGLISHAGKVMIKILQARLQQYVNC